MAHVDLSQDAASMRRILVSLGLADPDEAIHAISLAGGVSSGIYRVELRSGRYCLKQALPRLKVAKEWLVPVERVFSEVDWLRTVDRIVPGRVPRVLGLDEVSKSFVMEYLDEGYVNWKMQLLAGGIDESTAAQVGTVLGRIHAATADQPELAARFANDANFHAIRLEPYLVETARAHPQLSAQLLAMVERTANTRRVLVHGDVSPKNILVGPQGPVLLDAECAWFGDPAFDLAFCLNHFLLKAAYRPANGPDLLRCFRALADAYLGLVSWEPAQAVEERAAVLLPGLTLARIDGKSPVDYLDAAQRHVVRAIAARLVQEPPTDLAAIARLWAIEFFRT